MEETLRSHLFQPLVWYKTNRFLKERKEKKKKGGKDREMGNWNSERTVVRTGLHCVYLTI